jgi:hypothetical protein
MESISIIELLAYTLDIRSRLFRKPNCCLVDANEMKIYRRAIGLDQGPLFIHVLQISGPKKGQILEVRCRANLAGSNRLKTLPEAVLGISSKICTPPRSRLYGVTFPSTNSLIAFNAEPTPPVHSSPALVRVT